MICNMHGDGEGWPTLPAILNLAERFNDLTHKTEGKAHSEAKVAGRKVLVLYKLLICLVNLRGKERKDE